MQYTNQSAHSCPDWLNFQAFETDLNSKILRLIKQIPILAKLFENRFSGFHSLRIKNCSSGYRSGINPVLSLNPHYENSNG